MLVETYTRKGYVSQDDAPWLRYAIEKRLVTVMAFVPLLAIGILVTNPLTAIAFLITFYSLRTRTNGFHAKTIGSCFLYSILGEVFFLRVVPMVWNGIISAIILAVSSILIWILAPYNHPNMKMSSAEIIACANSAKYRLSMLIFVMIGLFACKQYQLIQGILLGIVMTASMLVIAYCIKQPNQKM